MGLSQAAACGAERVQFVAAASSHTCKVSCVDPRGCNRAAYASQWEASCGFACALVMQNPCGHRLCTRGKLQAKRSARTRQLATARAQG